MQPRDSSEIHTATSSRAGKNGAFAGSIHLGGTCVSAVRLLAKQPALTATAILTVALGVGANTAVFSVMKTVLLNPLGLRDTGTIVAATVRMEALRMPKSTTSGVEFNELQSITDVLSSVAAIEGRAWTSDTGGEPARLLGRAVTADFFNVFGQRPATGRFFTAEDREVVELSDRLFQSQFGGDASVIGRVLVLDDKPHRIVGVASNSFRYSANAQLWRPLVLSPERLQRLGNNMTPQPVREIEGRSHREPGVRSRQPMCRRTKVARIE